MNGVVVISAIGVVVVLLFLAFWWYVNRVQRLERAAHMVSELSARHEELKQRARMVENSAVGYVNSIGKEGAQLLEELQRRIEQTTYLVNELESLLISGEPSAVKEVEMFLCNDHPRQFNPERSYDGTVRLLRFDKDWDVAIEGILQKLGESVSQASIAATAVGVPKRRERKSTLMNLLDAGIDLLKADKVDSPDQTIPELEAPDQEPAE